MRTYKTDGIILKRKNFREADRILTVFTRKHGKIKVKAIGVRKINSRRSPHVELLNHSRLTLYRGQSLPILTEAEALEDFSEIKESLTKVGFAYHLCELVDGLCGENQENKKVFELLMDVLNRLSKEENVDIIHEFEINLLVYLGFYRQSDYSQNFNSSIFIENLLERKLKSRELIPRFIE